MSITNRLPQQTAHAPCLPPPAPPMFTCGIPALGSTFPLPDPVISLNCAGTRRTERAGPPCPDAVKTLTSAHSSQSPARFSTSCPDVLCRVEPCATKDPCARTLPHIHSPSASHVTVPTTHKFRPCSRAHSSCRRRLELPPCSAPALT